MEDTRVFENPVTHIPLKSAFTIEGRFIDVAHYLDGRSEVIRVGHNIVTDAGLGLVVGALGNLTNGVARWQVGSGDPAWDTAPIEATADTAELVAPVFIKPVTVSYWDREHNCFSPTPTDTIDVRAVFMAEEANAPLREFGLVGPDPEHVLFNYVIHERISKSENFNLERIMRITVRREQN
jgi:hypothetical protein